MRILVFVIILSCSQKIIADDFLWFEADWISNVEATIVANPKYNELNEEYKRKFRNLFGKTVWKISGGILTAVLENQEPYSTSYSITPIDEGSFHVFLSDNSSFKIVRIPAGICAVPPIIWLNFAAIWADPTLIECFRSSDA